MSLLQEQDFFNWPVYGVANEDKTQLISKKLNILTRHHENNCELYSKILQAHGYETASDQGLENIPFIPVRLFKEYELSSVPAEMVFKVLTSSGTTSQKVSRIILDREMAKMQTKALVRILQQFLGKSRLPMLIIDHPEVIKNRLSFSARGAGILGLSNFGYDHTYALSGEDMIPDLNVIQSFLERNKGKRIFIFGFTFMVWKYFYQALAKLPSAPKFEEAILIHSGGWKKLQDEAVGNLEFKRALSECFNINQVHNFYGMVEQVGSIFMECEHGRLHTPSYAEVLIRDAQDWSVLPKGKKGVVQVLSVLPSSYPGHSLLTEDLGEWIGIDDCPCGRLGKTFHIHGRLAKAELRGCSDTHASDFSQQN